MPVLARGGDRTYRIYRVRQPLRRPHLAERQEQATILMQGAGQKPVTVYVCLGYRDVDAQNPGTQIKHWG